MSLAFSFLREQVIEKRDAHDKQNASEEARINTIKNNIHVIESCTHSAPEIIGIFKERFAEYQKEKAQPSTWEKIQIAFARMWNTQTKKEEKYTQAKGNLRSLANTRKMATRGLRKLSSDEQTVISRDALVEKLNNPQYQTDTLQKKFGYSALLTAEKEEDFGNFIQTEGLTETVEKLRTLDEYLRTNPTYREVKTVMEKMSDITVRTIIKKYLLTQYAHEAGIILDIFAIEGIYSADTDNQTYWKAYNEGLKEAKAKGYNNNGRGAPEQYFKYYEIRRHTNHLDIWKPIIDSIDMTNCQNFGNGDQCIRGGYCFMADSYFSLPLHIQEYIVEKKSLPRGARDLFGQVHIKNMSPRDAAVYVLSNPPENSGYVSFSSYARDYKVCDSLSQEDYQKAAKTYLETHEYNDILTAEALKYLPKADKIWAASDYFSHGKFSLKNSVIFLKEIADMGGLLFDVGLIFGALEPYELQYFIDELYTFFGADAIPENFKTWIENDASLGSMEKLIKALGGIKTSQELKEKSEAVIGQLCKDWETTPYKICIQQAFGKVIQKKVQTLEQQEAERERQKQLQEKLTQ